MPASRYLFAAACALGLLATACTSTGSEGDYTPKPKGYNRIDLPPHAYQQLAPGHPYTFQYSRYAKVLRDSSYLAQPHWINIFYPALQANVQITYADLKGNRQIANRLLEDARKLTSKHEIKATAIDESILKTPNGMRVAVFKLQGEVPSQFQFYTTDSTRHFFRGALYFRTATANDSLAPIIDYVKKDVVQLLNTLKYQ
jgi:gliding motility-associated lipoprotein GldD